MNAVLKTQPPKRVLNIGRNFKSPGHDDKPVERWPNGKVKRQPTYGDKFARRLYRGQAIRNASPIATKLRKERVAMENAASLSSNSHEAARYVAADRLERETTRRASIDPTGEG